MRFSDVFITVSSSVLLMRYILFLICISIVQGSQQPAWKLARGHVSYIRNEYGHPSSRSTLSTDDISSEYDWNLSSQRKRPRDDSFELQEDQESGDENIDENGSMELVDGSGDSTPSTLGLTSEIEESIAERDNAFGHFVVEAAEAGGFGEDNENPYFDISNYYFNIIDWVSTMGEVRVTCLMEKNSDFPDGADAVRYIAHNSDNGERIQNRSVLTVYLIEGEDEPIAIYPTDSSVSRARRFVYLLKETEVKNAIDARNGVALARALQKTWARSSGYTQPSPQHIPTVDEVFGEEEAIEFKIVFENLVFRRATAFAEFNNVWNESVVKIGIHVPLANQNEKNVVLYPLDGQSLDEGSLLYSLLSQVSEMRISKHSLARDAAYRSELGNHIALRLVAAWEMEYYRNTNI